MASCIHSVVTSHSVSCRADCSCIHSVVTSHSVSCREDCSCIHSVVTSHSVSCRADCSNWREIASSDKRFLVTPEMIRIHCQLHFQQHGTISSVTWYYSLSNMVMALKELTVKSDFRTTIEFLITILEMEEFCNNNYDTSMFLLHARILTLDDGGNDYNVCSQETLKRSCDVVFDKHFSHFTILLVHRFYDNILVFPTFTLN